MLIITRELDEIVDLVKAKKLLQSVTPPYVPKKFQSLPENELLELLLVQLISRAGERDIDLLSYNFQNFGCGCMGPMSGDTFCGCEFSSLVKEYKEGLALLYLTRHDHD